MEPEPGPTIRASVLGPLLIESDGVALDLGGSKPRLLIASLLAAGGGVSTERLIDDVWGARPPASARKAVQVYVSHLRALLGGSFVLKSTPSGYRFATEAVMYDAAVFEAEVAAGAAMLDARPNEASVLLASALGRWRGGAFADLAGEPALAAEITRLEELRLLALDYRIGADLELGRHDELIGELEVLAEQHPYRESFRAKHMLALYRAGRQVDALRAYDRTQRVLRDEMGLEPTAELSRLQSMILQHADDLGTARTITSVAQPKPDPARQRPAPGPAPLHNLKPHPNEFIDRPEVDRLLDLMATHRITTIVGPGGMGKSRCAVAVGHRAVDQLSRGLDARWRGGVWFADLATLAAGSNAVAGVVAAALTLGQEGSLSTTQSLCNYFGDREALLILDNCEHVLDHVRAFVTELVGATPNVAVLATSRLAMATPGEQLLILDPMSQDEALRLFEARIAEAGLRPFPVDESGELCAMLDRFPLAIELAAGRCRAMSPKEVGARLGSHPRLLTSRRGDPRRGSFESTLEWSLEHLTPEARATLHRAAVFDGDFDIEAAEAVLTPSLDVGDGVSDHVIDLLDELVGHHLVSRDQRRRRFRILQPIRQVLTSVGPIEPQVQRRYVSYFGSLINRIAAGINGPDEAVWWGRLDDELANVRSAVRSAVARGDMELLERIMQRMPYLVSISAFTEPGRWADEALRVLAIDAAEVPNTALTAAAAWAHAGRLNECDRMLDRLEAQLDDPAILTRLHVIRVQCRPAEGVRWVEPLLASAAAADDPIGELMGRMRRLEPAAVDLADEIGAPSLQAIARSFVYAAMDGDARGRARPLVEEALSYALASSNSHAIAQMQLFMGAILGRSGEIKRGATLTLEAIERMLRLRSPQLVWHVVESVANSLAVIDEQPYTSIALWAAVDQSDCVPYARTFQDPRLPDRAATALSSDEVQAAQAHGATLDMDAAAVLARKACEQLLDR